MQKQIKKLIKRILAGLAMGVPGKSGLSVVEARKRVEELSACPTGSCVASNDVSIEYDIQVIIPAYNVENYVAVCLNSVIAQRFRGRYLITVVDDGSTDRTKAILDIYMRDMCENSPRGGEKNYDLEVITQENRGISGARNSALRILKGSYILFLDSDDFLPEDALQQMYDMAEETSADVVQGSWFDFKEGPTDIIGRHLLMEEGVLCKAEGMFSGYPWGKLYRYTVLEHFQFPEGFWFEDTPVSFILQAMPWRFAATKALVYGYRLNPNGITATAQTKPKSVDSYWITERCLEEFAQFKLVYDQRAYEYLLRQTVMNWHRTKEQPREVRESIFIMTVDLLKQYFPDLHTKEKTMQRLEKALRQRRFVSYEMLMRSI